MVLVTFNKKNVEFRVKILAVVCTCGLHSVDKFIKSRIYKKTLPIDGDCSRRLVFGDYW